jgi:N-acyl-L-homoserine lactone synthetase
MIRIITNKTIAVNAHYCAAFAALRHRVFVQRLGWTMDLATTSKGLEYDRFDTADATYILVCDADDQVAAGLRLLKTTAPCILFDCFPDLLAGPMPRSDRVMEVTRFVVDPVMARREEGPALVTRLLWGLFSYGLREGLDAFVSVSYAAMERKLRACGCRFRRLGAPRLVDGRLVVALAFDITEAVVAAIASRLTAPCAVEDAASVEAVIARQSIPQPGRPIFTN